MWSQHFFLVCRVKGHVHTPIRSSKVNMTILLFLFTILFLFLGYFPHLLFLRLRSNLLSIFNRSLSLKVLRSGVDYDPKQQCAITAEELGDGDGGGSLSVVRLSCSSVAIPCIFRQDTVERCLSANPR
jgi:hypothetical protein